MRTKKINSITILKKSIRYCTEDKLISIDGGQYHINPNLEIFDRTRRMINDGKDNGLPLFQWSNPKAGELPRTAQFHIGMSIAVLLVSVGGITSRSIWKSFDSVCNVALTRLRDGLTQIALTYQYRCAILECLRQNLKASDALRVSTVFQENELSGDNYHLYFILLKFLDRDAVVKNLKDPNLRINYLDLSQEVSELAADKYNRRLCQYHVTKKVSFICSSKNMPIEDMTSEVFSFFTVAYMKTRYLKGRLYSANYARAAAINILFRIIYAHTHYDEYVNVWKSGDNFVYRTRPLTEGDVNRHVFTGAGGRTMDYGSDHHNHVEDDLHNSLEQQDLAEKFGDLSELLTLLTPGEYDHIELD